MEIKEIAYAKINLALEVMNVVDGYHLVNNLMVPITLHDEIIISDSDSFVFDSNIYIENNICIKAYNIFCKQFNISKPCKIVLIKNIPSEAGLAGGSSDAASVLKGLNKYYGINASDEVLEQLGEELGSDVPFFINPTLSLCVNRGEKVIHLDNKFSNIDITIIKPKIGLSTKEVYKRYIWDKIDKKDRIDNIITSLNNNDIDSLKKYIFNDLAKYALMMSDDLKELYNYVAKEKEVFISGSGPSMYVFGDLSISGVDDVFIKKCQIIGGK